VLKSVIVDPNFDWRGEFRRRSIPWDHTIIYEAHVKDRGTNMLGRYWKMRNEGPHRIAGISP